MRNTLRDRGVLGFAAIVFVAAFACNPAGAASAQRLETARVAEPRGASARAADLEEVFWACDHAATAGMVDPDERAICAAVTEELKTDRFSGDFERMLDWWRANRALEHQRLDGVPGGVR
jgi:hypothetical protein